MPVLVGQAGQLRMQSLHALAVRSTAVFVTRTYDLPASGISAFVSWGQHLKFRKEAAMCLQHQLLLQHYCSLDVCCLRLRGCRNRHHGRPFIIIKIASSFPKPTLG